MAIQKVWDEEAQEFVYDDPDLDEREVEKQWQSLMAKTEDVDFSKMKLVTASPSILERMSHAETDKS